MRLESLNGKEKEGGNPRGSGKGKALGKLTAEYKVEEEQEAVTEFGIEGDEEF